MYCLPDIDENLTNYGPFLTHTVLVFQISANLKKKFFSYTRFFLSNYDYAYIVSERRKNEI